MAPSPKLRCSDVYVVPSLNEYSLWSYEKLPFSRIFQASVVRFASTVLK